jgi:hypothetical protein
MNITITLTDTEYKSLQYAAMSVQDWADNALKNRARIAKDEIIARLVKHCNENNVQLATGEDAQVTQAFDLGVVKTLADRQAEIDTYSPTLGD